MPSYRRYYVPGGTWFFTVTLLDRNSSLLVERIAHLRTALVRVKRQRPFRIEAMTVLPDHLHAIWTLPEGDADFSTRWRLIKSAFSRLIEKSEWRSPRRIAKGERAIWQRRFWEHCIETDTDFARHIDYCYYNPVKHGLVERVRDWPHSTYHRDVRCGRFERDFDFDGEVGGEFGDAGAVGRVSEA